MTEGELTKLVKRHYANVSEGQIERDRDIVADDIVHVNAAIGTVSGIEAVLAFASGFKQAFPDLHWDVREFIEGTDIVVVEGIFLGTNTGPMVGPTGTLPATGRHVEIPSATFGRYAMGELSRIVSTMTKSHS
jgi:steroid delta-isomerase-like uncharacterized protein